MLAGRPRFFTGAMNPNELQAGFRKISADFRKFFCVSRKGANMSGEHANNPEQPALKLTHLSLENAAKILSTAVERAVPIAWVHVVHGANTAAGKLHGNPPGR